ncbi:flagellin [Parablautia intestinalis]|uniref:Flagellin n=2 Tax=Parablautia intestinalis TaxID=2320100 RepID=A0A3A9AMU9_9FIRM|nr:flagellin [Parablautia intestinalis]MDE7048044.1 flagellin [Lachnospiraceae bacterium]RKI92344.1 flagellin [Parablautia intestinalis]
MVIVHNMAALNANRMFNLTNKEQAKSTEKLSSGYKINRAADDAAGLAISEKMRRQVRGLTQASANSADGISCIQTAEGALTEVHDMLQRMNELSVKGATGTLTSEDRVYITLEVRELMNEIDRIHSTTTFNEQNLLDGSFQDKQLQVGAESGQHISISIGNLSTNDLIASALSKGIMYRTDVHSSYCRVTEAPILPPNKPGDLLYWYPPVGSNATFAKDEYRDYDAVLPAWGLDSGHCHILASYDLTVFHSFSYNSITDENIKDKLTNNFQTNATGGSEEALVNAPACTHNFDALNAFTKSAISDVSRVRANLGAIQNRLEHTIKNLDNVVENTTAAESSIRDTDMATEMVKYSNSNIISQAGQTLLAQANQTKQGVLALLQ